MKRNKIRSAGSKLYTPAKVYCTLSYNNKADVRYEWASKPAYYRKSGLDQSIRYETGNDGRQRPVVNSRTRYNAYPLQGYALYGVYPVKNSQSYITRQAWSNVLEYAHAAQYQAWINWSGPYGAAIPNPSAATVQNLAITALETMLPSINDGNSILNFVYELKDFHHLFNRRFLDLRGRLERLIAGVTTVMKKSDWRKYPMRSLSKSYLSYQFGFASFFRDVVSLSKSLEGLYRKFVRLEEEEGQMLTRHFKSTVPGTELSSFKKLETQTLPTGIASYTPYVECWYEANASEPMQFSATMRYRYALPSVWYQNRAEAYKLATLDALGINGNWSLVWNAIPFSFIVDWFANVNGFLKRLQWSNIQFATEIDDFSYTLKSSRTASLKLRTFTGVPSQTYGYVIDKRWQDYITTDEIITDYYIRSVGAPPAHSTFIPTGLNWKQIFITSALVGSRRKT